MKNLVEFEIENNSIAVVTLNRPEVANSMSEQMLNELNTVIQTIDQNPAVYCTIITGNNNKSFCAGADLKERKGMTEYEVISTVKYIGDTIKKIEQMRMPVIAAINGVAFGGGLELALACDLRIAADHVRMGLTETSLAIIPGAGGTQRLTRLIGLGQAKRLVFTASQINAEEALRIGLIEEIVDSDSLLSNAIELATSMIMNGPIALKQAKIAIHQGYQTDLHTGLAIEHACYKRTIHTKDRQEGLVAFQEKRKPEYKGK